MLKMISILYSLHLFKFHFDSEVTKTKVKGDHYPHLNLLFISKVKTCIQKNDFLHKVKNSSGRNL